MLKQIDTVFYTTITNRSESSSFVFDILFSLLCIKPGGTNSTQKLLHHSELSPVMKLIWIEVLSWDYLMSSTCQVNYHETIITITMLLVLHLWPKLTTKTLHLILRKYLLISSNLQLDEKRQIISEHVKCYHN